mgnify:CR=1 FL=1
MTQAGPRVQLSHVGLAYRGENDSVVALDDVTLSVAPGEAVAIIGPSGCEVLYAAYACGNPEAD